ncbi:MAG: hypothetical protein CMJ49_01125 [Planctomycetaceae bacterium]|nr:hypothetical protein [Planctomycetaceae bacterium]
MNRAWRQMSWAMAIAGVWIAGPVAGAVEVHDIARIKGAESNKLVGVGLVVGLPGTGDGGKFYPAMRRLSALMQKLGDSNVDLSELKDVKNVAIVTVTAFVPKTGAREGDLIDLRVSSIGSASSLEGGTLFMTPLKGPVPGSPVYAFAEGAVVVEDENSPTTGVVKRGAQMSRDIFAQSLDEYGRLTIVLDQAHAGWPLANTIASLVNEDMSPDGPAIARAVDPKNVIVQVPGYEAGNPSAFIARVLEMPLPPELIRSEARVVINEKTGSIVMTGDVQMSPVMISHPGLTITTITPEPPPTTENPRVRQDDFVGVDPRGAGGSRLSDLLAAFNQLKVPAKDRISIIKEIHRSGKLHAKLILEH